MNTVAIKIFNSWSQYSPVRFIGPGILKWTFSSNSLLEDVQVLDAIQTAFGNNELQGCTLIINDITTLYKVFETAAIPQALFSAVKNQAVCHHAKMLPVEPSSYLTQIQEILPQVQINSLLYPTKNDMDGLFVELRQNGHVIGWGGRVDGNFVVTLHCHRLQVPIRAARLSVCVSIMSDVSIKFVLKIMRLLRELHFQPVVGRPKENVTPIEYCLAHNISHCIFLGSSEETHQRVTIKNVNTRQQTIYNINDKQSIKQFINKHYCEDP